MPNWCSTIYRFHGDRNEIVSFRNKIVEWMDADFVQTSFGKNWLGNILYGAGLQDRIDDDNQDRMLGCRGIISEISDIHPDGTFEVVTLTAWIPMAKMWNEVIKALGYGIKFAFQAVEHGCCLYWIYDPGFDDFGDDLVHIYANINGVRYEGGATEKDAVDTLNSYYHLNATNLDSAIVMCEELVKNDNDFVSINRFETARGFMD